MLFFKPRKKHLSLASKILIGMLAGLIVGIILKALPHSTFVNYYLIDGLFQVVGKLFITLLEMLVVPIVFVSLVCGTCSLGGEQLGRISFKVIFFFLATTAIAVTIGLFLANLFHIGTGLNMTLPTHFHVPKPMTIKQTILNLVPSNPIQAMADGNLLQIIIFSILIGIAISLSGSKAKRIAEAFHTLNHILMKLIELVMKLAPYGVFCLIAEAFAKIGYGLIADLLMYCIAIFAALAIQTVGVYSLLLTLLARLNPIIFFKKMASAMLFAFGTSSSNASIPIMLETTEFKLGVSNFVSAFTVPLGATINMDGTAIMQGVASVFIAHIYHITLTTNTYIAIVATATLASIGTAGVPGVGIITLAMVLQQAGLPIAGIGLLIGVDRLMDMLRTVTNVTGDAVTSCIVGKSEKAIDLKIYKTEKQE